MWDDWIGQGAVQGFDPREWDLRQLCSAFEQLVKSNCKDDAEWQRTRAKLYAPVPGGRQGGAKRPEAPAMASGDVGAMLAALGAENALYGLEG